MVKRVIVENVGKSGYAVLNAADPTWRPWRRTVRATSPSSPGPLPTHHGDPPRPGKRVVYAGAIPSSAQRGQERNTAFRWPRPHHRGGTIGFRSRMPGRHGRRLGPKACPGETIAAGLASFVNDARRPRPAASMSSTTAAPPSSPIMATTRTPSRPWSMPSTPCRPASARWSSAAPETAATRTSGSRRKFSATPSTR